jgi:hypothetical protein
LLAVGAAHGLYGRTLVRLSLEGFRLNRRPFAGLLERAILERVAGGPNAAQPENINRQHLLHTAGMLQWQAKLDNGMKLQNSWDATGSSRDRQTTPL